jgi:hypothetical protein
MNGIHPVCFVDRDVLKRHVTLKIDDSDSLDLIDPLANLLRGSVSVPILWQLSRTPEIASAQG